MGLVALRRPVAPLGSNSRKEYGSSHPHLERGHLGLFLNDHWRGSGSWMRSLLAKAVGLAQVWPMDGGRHRLEYTAGRGLAVSQVSLFTWAHSHGDKRPRDPTAS